MRMLVDDSNKDITSLEISSLSHQVYTLLNAPIKSYVFPL